MGAVSFPIIAVAENWGTDVTLALKVTVVEESTGKTHFAEMWIDTHSVFPGDVAAVGNGPAAPPPEPADGKGPTGTVRFVEPQTGQPVSASRFSIVALGENWGVDSYLHIAVEVSDVATGHLSYADCRCNTHPAFPGQVSQGSY